MATGYNGIITNAELNDLTPIPEMPTLNPNKCPKYADIQAYSLPIEIRGSYKYNQLVKYQDISVVNYTPIYYGFTNDLTHISEVEVTELQFGFAVADGVDPVNLGAYDYIGFDESGEMLPYGILASSSGVDLTRLWIYGERFDCYISINFSPNGDPRPEYIDLVAYVSDENGNPKDESSYQVLGTLPIEEGPESYFGHINIRGDLEDLVAYGRYNQISFMMVFKSSMDDQYWNEGSNDDEESILVSVVNNSSYQARISYMGENYTSESFNLNDGENSDLYIPRDYSPSYNISIRLTDGSSRFSVQTLSEKGESNYDPNYSGYVNIPYSDIYMYPDGYYIYILNP